MYSESHQANDNISIHALREESDTFVGEKEGQTILISIHALREESDSLSVSVLPIHRYFNPRSP